MPVKLSALQDSAGATIGQSIYLSPSLLDDLIINGRRYLKAGNIETDPNEFDPAIFTNVYIGDSSFSPNGFTAAIVSAIYALGVYIMMENSGDIITSPDGVTWSTPLDIGIVTSGYDMAFGAGVVVVTGYNGQIFTSPDLINWTSRTSALATSAYDIEFAAGQFVAVGNSGGLMTSPDGITWTARTSAHGTDSINGIGHGNGLWVAVGSNGKISTSPDGITWTLQGGTPFGTNTLNTVNFGGGVYVVGGNPNIIGYSSDATTWVLGATGLSSSSAINDIIFDGLHFAVGKFGDVISSDDGINWTKTEIGTNDTIFSLTTDEDGELIFGVNGGQIIKSNLINFAGSLTPSTQGAANRYVRIT